MSILYSSYRYYLHGGYCKKVVICQMRDREGFSELLTRLQTMDIAYQVHEVTEEQYTFAQSIKCKKVHGGVGTSGGSGVGIKTSTGTASSSAYRERANSEESSDVISKIFTFPACIGDGSAGIDVSGVLEKGDHLLHSAKENFVFLTIG